jgi:hypothetical protein
VVVCGRLHDALAAYSDDELLEHDVVSLVLVSPGDDGGWQVLHVVCDEHE